MVHYEDEGINIKSCHFYHFGYSSIRRISEITSIIMTAMDGDSDQQWKDAVTVVSERTVYQNQYYQYYTRKTTVVQNQILKQLVSDHKSIIDLTLSIEYYVMIPGMMNTNMSVFYKITACYMRIVVLWTISKYFQRSYTVRH